MNIVSIFVPLLRMIEDAPAAQKLRDYESPESPKEKEPPDRPPGILEEKDKEERRVTRAVNQLWAGSGLPIKVKDWITFTRYITADHTSLCHLLWTHEMDST